MEMGRWTLKSSTSVNVKKCLRALRRRSDFLSKRVRQAPIPLSYDIQEMKAIEYALAVLDVAHEIESNPDTPAWIVDAFKATKGGEE